MSQGQPSPLAVVEGLVYMLERGVLEAGYNSPIRLGSAHGNVAVMLSPAQRSRLLVITFEIMRAPTGARTDFLHRLLQLNATLMGRAAFSLNEDQIVYLQAGRPIEDLDPGELVELIMWTAEQADRLDDVLLEEFGRELAL